MPKRASEIYEEILDDFRHTLDEPSRDKAELMIAHIEGQFESLTADEEFDFWPWLAQEVGEDFESIHYAYQTLGERVKPIVHHGKMHGPR